LRDRVGHEAEGVCCAERWERGELRRRGIIKPRRDARREELAEFVEAQKLVHARFEAERANVGLERGFIASAPAPGRRAATIGNDYVVQKLALAKPIPTGEIC
jgi:hypothetical protein